MLDFNWRSFYSTFALTNGTDESALNPDGKFEVVGQIGYQFANLFYLSSSLLFSDDTSDSGGAGLATKLGAMIIDGRLQLTDNLKFEGYVGQLTFDDKISSTKNDVKIMMAEGSYTFTPDFNIARRISIWNLEDDEGNGLSHFHHLILLGFNGTFGTNSGMLDQQVSRLQLGLGYQLIENLQLKSEIFVEDYKKDKNITGVILALNASF